mmetsp:Transcript_18763/g.16614  ORF Transcript_18763/g.16614 Transcript_18763/m.16614 type:complete len:101 (+) Transcript_18763:362-664(+)
MKDINLLHPILKSNHIRNCDEMRMYSPKISKFMFRIFGRILDTAIINNFFISSSIFSKIVLACNHVINLNFANCRLEYSEKMIHPLTKLIEIKPLFRRVG